MQQRPGALGFPDWPPKGKVDGSAHLLGDHGLIFLFNPDPVERTAELALTRKSTGFAGSTPVNVSQEYPPGNGRETHQPGANLRWPIPAESAVILRLKPLR